MTCVCVVQLSEVKNILKAGVVMERNSMFGWELSDIQQAVKTDLLGLCT